MAARVGDGYGPTGGFVYLGSGDGTFQPWMGISYEAYNAPLSLSVGDFNVEHKLEQGHL